MAKSSVGPGGVKEKKPSFRGCAPCDRLVAVRGRGALIYLICKDGEILVETDSLEFARAWVQRDGEVSVRDARTGKSVAIEAGWPGVLTPDRE
jgi:hypothetical protein